MKLGKRQKKWLKGLRSGEYKKGVGYLNKNQEYCCLGVACEIFKDELKLEKKAYQYMDSVMVYGGRGSSAPDVLVEHLGLHDDAGFIDDITTLAHLNDGRYKYDTDFNNIANYIEKNADKIFKESL